jgi:hypothetical protein
VNCFVVAVVSGPGKKDKKGICLSLSLATQELGMWKPTIRYYDFYAGTTKAKKSDESVYRVKQIFPYVKVRFSSLSFLFAP